MASEIKATGSPFAAPAPTTYLAWGLTALVWGMTLLPALAGAEALSVAGWELVVSALAGACGAWLWQRVRGGGLPYLLTVGGSGGLLVDLGLRAWLGGSFFSPWWLLPLGYLLLAVLLVGWIGEVCQPGLSSQVLADLPRSQSTRALWRTLPLWSIAVAVVVWGTLQYQAAGEQVATVRHVAQTTLAPLAALPAEEVLLAEVVQAANRRYLALGSPAVLLWYDTQHQQLRKGAALPEVVQRELPEAIGRPVTELAGGYLVTQALVAHPAWRVGVWLPAGAALPPGTPSPLLPALLPTLLLTGFMGLAVLRRFALLDVHGPQEWLHLDARLQSTQRAVRTAEQASQAHQHRAGELQQQLTGLSDTLLSKNRELSQALADLRSEETRREALVKYVSHELRQPMHTILGLIESWVSALSLGSAPLVEASDLLSEDMEVVMRQGHLMLGFINDLLDLVRFEVSQVPLETQAVELTPLLRHARQAVTPLLLPGVSLRHLPADGVWVLADARWLERALVNLLSNAAKYTTEGLVGIAVEITETHVGLRVLDTGPGIAPERLEQIFQPFHSTPITDSRRLQSTGLGLTLTQYLIEQMGGTIGVESDLGEGSAFTLWLHRALTP